MAETNVITPFFGGGARIEKTQGGAEIVAMKGVDLGEVRSLVEADRALCAKGKGPSRLDPFNQRP